MKWMILSSILLVSCADLNNYYRYDSFAGIDGVDRGVDIYQTGGCARYGVAENHQSMGRVVVAMPVHWTEVSRLCGRVEGAVSGCAIADHTGAVRLYWIKGLERKVQINIFRDTDVSSCRKLAKKKSLSRCLANLHTIGNRHGCDNGDGIHRSYFSVPL